MSKPEYPGDEFEDVLERASKIPPGRRLAFLKNSFGDKETLVEQALGMLEAVEKTRGFLEEPLVNYIAKTTLAAEELLREDLAVLEGYENLDLVGEGGMGKVFRAQQVHPIARQVALKVMKIHPLDHQRGDLFQKEMLSLAQMEHPNIARLYETGVTKSGFPFFTMEFIQGVALRTFLATYSTSLNCRLNLFLQICKGVAHAHQKGIIHHDIKPSNILILGCREEDFQAKLIDFGVSRLKELPDLQPENHAVDARAAHGTLAYMSPEQLQGFSADVRVDIYGLGAVLYEMLTGEPVFDWTGTRGPTTRLEALNQVLDANVIPPGQRLKNSNSGKPRGISIKISEDLDAVVLKALEKSREKRYSSIDGLSADIQNILERRPVNARRKNRRHAFFLWVRRNQLSTIAGITVALAIGAGFGMLYLGLKRAEKERAHADLQKQSALISLHQTNNLAYAFESLLRATEPGRLPPDTAYADVLDVVAEKVTLDWVTDPKLKSRIHFVLGDAYMAISSYQKAAGHYHQSLLLRKSIFGEGNAATLSAMIGYGWAQVELGFYSLAKVTFEDVLEQSQPSYLHYRAMLGLADAYRKLGNLNTSIALYEEALEKLPFQPETKTTDILVNSKGLALSLLAIGSVAKADTYFDLIWHEQAETLGVDAVETLDTYLHWGIAKLRSGSVNEAMVMIETGYQGMVIEAGQFHRKTLDGLQNLTVVQINLGNYLKAEKSARALVMGREKRLDANHPDVLTAEMILGNVLGRLGKTGESIQILESVYQRNLQVFGERHKDTWIAASNLANQYKNAGNFEPAEEILKKIHLFQTAKLGPKHRDTLVTHCTLGEVYLDQKRFEEALQVFEEITSLLEADETKDSNWPLFQFFHGKSLEALKRFSEAEPYFLRALEALPNNQEIVMGTVSFYIGWGKPALAKKVEKNLE